jgi:hypothetical protein
VRRLRAPSLEALFIATYGLFGFRGGAVPINDNSMFLHLRTGVKMATTGAIPRTDPYSFTAHGSHWVVQSWLAEWTYGWLNRLGDTRLVVLEQAVLMALVATLTGRLARAGTPLRTAAATGLALGVGALWWSQRPLLFGLLAFALMALIVERRRPPWLLLPVVWVWVNSHGSFPLGLVWLGAVAVGLALDERALPRQLLRYIGAFVVGLAVACVNPLGPRLVAFPVTVEQKRKVFATVAEWMSPSFQGLLGLFTLVSLIACLLVLFRRRPPWRDAVPFVVFVGLGLIALRNLPVAAIAVAPVMGRALRPLEAPDPRAEAPGINMLFALGLAAAIGFTTIGIFGHNGLSDDGYPVAAVRYMERTGLLGPGHRVAEQDVVGCYLIRLRGDQARVFIDDRVDMYPIGVSNDYDTLLHGFPGSLAVLDSRSIDVVLWDSRQPLAGILAESGKWERRVRAGQWEVWVRRAV